MCSMPVRRIGLCYRSVSGRVPMGAGRPVVAVESTLERDFALLQRFDTEVAHVEEQPVRVEYRDASGARRRYVPDFLVHYKPGRVPRLVEIKFSTDPALASGEMEERFAAARAYAGTHGWMFSVVTEKDIRTPRLENATFLIPFRARTANANICARLLTALGGSPTTVQALADEVASATGCDRGEVLPALWRMVAHFEMGTDLDDPLTMGSLLYLPERGRP